MGLITEMMKLIHKTCGAQIGWYHGPEPITHGQKFKSTDISIIKGAEPVEGEPFYRRCPICRNRINSVTELSRE